MKKFDFSGFVRECYLRSEPSVDLNEVTEENPVNCCEHRLAISEYERICREFDVKDEYDAACGMWMIQSGPQLVDA